MGFQSDTIAGIASLIQGAGIAVWDVTGTYQGPLPLIAERVLPAIPDSGIAISTYGVSDDPRLSTSVIGIQIMCRHAGRDPRPTDDLCDSIFDLLHGLSGVTLSTGVRIVLIERHSSVSLGRDDVNRWTVSDNYYATVHRPGAHRL